MRYGKRGPAPHNNGAFTEISSATHPVSSISTLTTSRGRNDRRKSGLVDVLWQLAGAERLEAATPAGTRYAVTADIDATRTRMGTADPTT